ncbi:hypothetical protein ACROYT_G030661 [Oculina patagonica]
MQIENMATFMAVFKTHCDLCPCMFNTTTALLRHRESKHHIITESATSFPFYNGQELVQIPKQRGRRSSSYKQWLSGIVDSINSCLHPKAAGKQSTVPLTIKKSYLGDKEIAPRNEPQNARQALELAKEKARNRTETATMQIEMVVGLGKGRASREFEVIWWPDLFSSASHGKLTLTFYVSKVLL